MHISLNTAEPISDQDRRVIAALLGETSCCKGSSTLVPVEDVAEPKSVSENKAAAAALAAAALKKTAAKTAAKKAAAKPVVAAEPEDEESDYNPDESNGPTVEDALAVARPLANAGKTSVIKAALTEVGAKRVGDLTPEQVAPFIALLAEKK